MSVLKYLKQLKVAQTSVFTNCLGHRFIYLWLRKEFPARRLSKEQTSPVLHGHLGQLALPFLILMLMQFKQPKPAFFYLCNKPIFRSLSCVSLNHNIPIEKNLNTLLSFGDEEGSREKVHCKNSFSGLGFFFNHLCCLILGSLKSTSV